MDTDTLKMLGDSLDRLLDGHKLIDAAPEGGPSEATREQDLWKDLAEFGILGLFSPEDEGGFDGDLEVVSRVMQNLGKHLAAEPYLSTAIVSAKLLRSLGCETALRQIEENEIVCALAHWETEELSEQTEIACQAQSVENGWSISGSKAFVSESANTTHLLVTAALPDGAEIGLFLVPCESAGIQRQLFKLLDNTAAANLQLDQVEVSKFGLICKLPVGSSHISDAWDMGAIAVCAESLGVLTELVQSTVEYVKQREQFGKPISEFQAVQHRLAEMICELRLAESMVFLLLSQPYDALRVSSAKFRIGRASRAIRHGAVQLHGGIGTTDELVLSRYFKRAAVIERSYGSTEAHLARYETLRGYAYSPADETHASA